MKLSLGAYSAVVSSLYCAGYPYLAWRYREGFAQRRGVYEPSLAESFSGARPLWVHAASVGEVQAAFPLVKAMRSAPLGPIILSTITPTGKAMAQRLCSGMIDAHIYYPWDVPWIVRRSLGALRPKAYVAVEAEIWPLFLSGLAERGIPAFLVNGRFSDRSFEKARKNAAFWLKVLGAFRFLMVRGETDRERLLALGVDEKRVIALGDCKIDALVERRKEVDLPSLRQKLFLGPYDLCLVAGSTHEGEEDVVFKAWDEVRRRFPCRLIVVPRHPERSPKVLKEAGRFGKALLLTQISPGWDILVVDAVGYLFDLYGLSRAAFVGGSLVSKGGQNVLEPACWGIPVFCGPHMEDFAAPAEELLRLGALKVVSDEGELARGWSDSLAAPDGDFKRSVERYFTPGAAVRAWEIIKSSL